MTIPESVHHYQGMATNRADRAGASAEPLLSPQDLSDLCGVPIGTVYQWNYRRVGPRAIKVGKHVRYRPADVEAWLESNAQTAS